MTDLPPADPTPTTPGIPQGWYNDASTNRMRWWDGGQWTDHFQDSPAAVVTQTPTTKRKVRVPVWAFIVVAVASLIVGFALGSVGRGGNSQLAAANDRINELEQQLEDARGDGSAAQPTADADEPAADAPPAGDAVTFAAEGEGSSAQAVLSGDYVITWQTFGDCYYSADLEGGSDFLPPQVFTASTATSGTNNVYDLDDGEYYVEVITGPAPGCGWTVTFTSQ